MPKMIYLDYNATTPLAAEVAAAMRPYLEGRFGNPSSSHRLGIEARQAVETARRQVASLLGCAPDEIVFTSGGTESNNMAITGSAWLLRDKGRRILIPAVEHPAVIEVCRFLETQGYGVVHLPVDSTGLLDPATVESAVTSDTILVSVMHANNEVGTVQPVAEVAKVIQPRGIRLHSDGAQAAGKIPVDVRALGVDLYSVAGHKLYAPKGVGALFIRRGIQLARLMHGANHEQNRRPGTENVMQIAGLGMAAEIAARDLDANSARMRALRDRLFEALSCGYPELHRNGHTQHCLPNTLSVSFPRLEANVLLDELGNVAASAGAACHAGEVTVSQVLAAMKVPEEIAMGTIRFSLGRETTEEEIDAASKEILSAALRLKGDAGGDDGGDAADDRESERVPAGGPVRLTRFTRGLGCACKIRPQILEEILAGLPLSQDPDLLVGTETSDDAAVYRLTDDIALVETLDFFTPIVDDPRAFGAIAAANALSDIYAMGARPLFALNIVGFPVNRLPIRVLQEILQGAADKAAEAGIPIVGGHSVEDSEPKFGWAVTGVVHPDRILTNRGARPGDALILTKPIGLGILSTAAKRGAASPAAIARGIGVMSALNRAAAEAMAGARVHACTDVTGFGLIGHLLEMTSSSGVDAEVWAGAVPVLEEARELAQAGLIPGGTRDNLEHCSPHLDWDPEIPEVERLLLCDAQTSGGLLIIVNEEDAPDLLRGLQAAGVEVAARIGGLSQPGTGRIRVRAGTQS